MFVKKLNAGIVMKIDPNGNILGYLRNGDVGNTMDSLNYKYYASINKLSQVTDNVSATKYPHQWRRYEA